MRKVEELGRDSILLADFGVRHDAISAAARLALRAYASTAQAIHSLGITEKGQNEEEQRRYDLSLLGDYRDAAFEAIVHFQHFAELVIKDALRADHELLVVLDEQGHSALHDLVHNRSPAEEDVRRLRTIEASLALERATALLKSGRLDQSWQLIVKHKQTIEQLNGLRNRLWHRGELVLRYRALDELIGGYALGFFFDVMKHPKYAGKDQTWTHKSLVCGLDPFPLIAAEFTQSRWSLEKVAFLKELARAAYENPLIESEFFADEDKVTRQRAEAVAENFPEREVERVTGCPVCGMNALLVYRGSVDTTDDEGNERSIDYVARVRCEGCSLDLQPDYGNPSKHGLSGIEDYFGEI